MPNMIRALLNLLNLSQDYMFNLLPKSMNTSETECESWEKSVQKLGMKSHVIIFSMEELMLKQSQTCQLEYLALELLVKLLFEAKKMSNKRTMRSVLRIYRENISVFGKIVRCKSSLLRSRTMAMEIVKELMFGRPKKLLKYMFKVQYISAFLLFITYTYIEEYE